MQEIWKAVVGHEGMYEVSSAGRVRSLDRICTGPTGRTRRRSGQLMRCVLDRYGYHRVILSSEHGRHSALVHRLVAQAFCPNPEGLPVINHLDGVKLNNTPANLEWTTVQGNTIHSYDKGLQAGRKGENHHMGRLNDSAVLEILGRLQGGETATSIAKDYGVSFSLVCRIKKGARWGHLQAAQ